MAKLIITTSTGSTEHVIDGTLTIGRSSDNTIDISDEAQASRNHARIELTPQGVTLTDLNSSNGTKVNGTGISNVILKDGDTIEIGKVSIRFVDESNSAGEETAPGKRDLAATMMPASGSASAAVGQPKRLNWLWLTLGIFFFVSYFVPIMHISKVGVLFFWSFFGSILGRAPGATALGVYAIAIAVIGVALPVVAFVVPGIARSITIASLGVMGIVFGMVGLGSAEGGMVVFSLFMLLSIFLALAGARLRADCPGSLFCRLFGVITAGVACGMTIGYLITYLVCAANWSKWNFIVMSIVTIVSMATMLAGTVFLIINVANHQSIGKFARLAKTLIVIGILTMTTWSLANELITGIQADGTGRGLWQFLCEFRVEVYVFGSFLMYAVGLAQLLGPIFSRRSVQKG